MYSGNAPVIDGHIVSGMWRNDAELPGGKLSGLIFKNHLTFSRHYIVDLEKIVRVHFFYDIADVF